MSLQKAEGISEDLSISSNDETSRKKGASSLPKKRQTARVARILKNSVDFPHSPHPQTPPFGSQSAPQQQTAQSFPQVFPQAPALTSFLQNTQVPCVGRVINGHISFTLFPKMPKLYCPFSFAHSPGHNVVLVFYPNYTIPYVLNGTPSIYNGTEVDVTSQLTDGENYLIVNTTAVSQEVLASIEWRDVDTAEDIVQKIIRTTPPMEISPLMQVITDECPLGKKQIQTPGRGTCCEHCQCFDLTTFIKFAQSTGNWNCPVCGKILNIDLLRYDPSYLKNCGTLFLGDDFGEDAGASFF